MTVDITARHFTIRQELREYTEEKIRKLGRLVESLDIHVTLEPEKQHQKRCYIVATGRGETYKADVSGEDFHAAVNESVDILARQLRKSKTSKLAHRREGADTIRHPERIVPADDVPGG